MHNHLSAILWVLASTFIWTVIFAAGKIAGGDIGVFQLTLARYVGALAVVGVLVRAEGGVRAHRSTQPWRHLARAICGCGAAVAITWASANMPLVDATAIGMLYGLFAVLLGGLVLNETIGARQRVGILVCVAGVVLVMINKGAFRSGVVILPALAALLSAVLMAVEGMLISVLGRGERALGVMLHVTVFGCVLMLAPALMQGQSPSTASILFGLALGPLALLGQYCTIRGYRLAPLSVVAPIDYTWLFFSAVLSVMVFAEAVGLWTWVGCAVIVLGGALIARQSTRD
ncbi:MAG: DMT family transporter [Pseudomonadota bacterium]